MIVKNERNLPEALVRVIEETLGEPHNKPGCYSVTTLQNGVCEVQLTNRYFNEIEVEASKEIWAVFGTAIHSLLERTNKIEDGYITERRVEYLVYGSKGAITAKCDLINFNSDEPIVEDYKTTKSSALMFPDTIKKWEKQLLGYCALLRADGINVHKGKIYAMLKDWSEMEAKRGADSGYPDAPMQVIYFNFTLEQIDDELLKLIYKFKENKVYESFPDEDLPLCSKEERWAKEPKFAITKIGATRATKLCDTKEEAQELLKTKYNPIAYEIEERKGEDTKCLYFCKAKQFCPYYKKNYLFELKKSED